MTTPLLPVEIETQCKYINAQWFPDFSHTVEARYVDGEYVQQWRLFVVDKENNDILEHLMPETTDGFAIKMALKAVTNAYNRGVVVGRLSIMKTFIAKQCHSLSISVSDLKEFL
jgi:hypothetical protein